MGGIATWSVRFDRVKAILKAVQCSLRVTTGKSLSDFVCDSDYAAAGASLIDGDLPPLSARCQLRIAKPSVALRTGYVEKGSKLNRQDFTQHLKPPSQPKVADEETTQWRGFNLLYSVLKVRGFPSAELCHPLWNDYKRSVSKSGLLGCMLKCTATCNYGHGPWQAGDRFVALEKAGARLMRRATPEFMQDLSERVSFDRRIKDETYIMTEEEFLSSRTICRRTPFVFRLQLWSMLET